jgi:MATE family multidrug resistance protein
MFSTLCFRKFSRAIDAIHFNLFSVGADNPKLAGIYLQVAYVVLSGVAIVVILAWNVTERVWVSFGSDAEISEMAGYYASVLSISIPGQLIFTQLSQFFSAQRIMRPEVNASTFALVCNLVFGLLFVLGIPPIIPNFEGFGFTACPWVTTSAVYIQFLLVWFVYIHRQQLHEPCWGGWSLDEITWPRIKTFSHLYFPSAFGVASDFWRVAVIGTIAASLGEEQVAIFNTSYRIMWIVLVMVMALSGASGINMSMRLGRMDSHGAKQAGHVGVGMASFVACLIGIAVWVEIRAFGRIFTDDEIFLNMFAEARTPFCITLVLMNVAVAIEKIPYSMGRTQGRYLVSASRFGLFDVQVLLASSRLLLSHRGILVRADSLVGLPSTCGLCLHQLLENGSHRLVYRDGAWLWRSCCTLQLHRFHKVG